MRVLLVEDEPHLRAMMARGLQADGFVVATADNGQDGLWQASEEPFDVILLDIMLPKLSGYEVLRQLRDRQVWTPVLMLTAKDGDYDQIDALDLGADDYLVKPVSFALLTAHIRALVRRGATQRPVSVTVGNVTIDPARHLATVAEHRLSLTPREFALLLFLMRNADTALSKTVIAENVWDANFEGDDNIVEVYVRYLRRKLMTARASVEIETLRGVGYRLTATD